MHIPYELLDYMHDAQSLSASRFTPCVMAFMYIIISYAGLLINREIKVIIYKTEKSIKMPFKAHRL